MKIKKMEIQNFRNIEAPLYFKEHNYIVGENGIGKSNLFDCLRAVFSTHLEETDFLNPKMPILIRMIFQVEPDETGGICQDFKVINQEIRISLKQYIYDTYPTIIDLNTKRKCDSHVLHKIQCSLLAEKHTLPEIQNLEEERIYLERLSRLDQRILHDETFERPWRAQNQNTYYRNSATILYWMILSANQSFYSIEERIVYKNGKRYFPILFGMDEPENHLHPYAVRSLVDYMARLLSNQVPEFLQILKERFQIDGLDATFLVVTHSTDTLIDDYHSIIRFYRQKGKIKVICGASISLPEDVTKHMSIMFSEIKEVFFCKAAILVEGITEYGAFKEFAKTIGYHFDYYGIALVNSEGEGAMTKLQLLLQKFQIPCFLMFDGDVKEEHSHVPHAYFTKEVCFEMEIVSYLLEKKREDLLLSILKSLPGYETQKIDEIFVKRAFEKLTYVPKFPEGKALKEYSINEPYYRYLAYAFLYKRKGIYLGRVVGRILPKDCIPRGYAQLLQEAYLQSQR